VFHGKADRDTKLEKLVEQYNGLLKELKQTYPEKGE
jgi:hypothetical protein